MNQTIVFFGPAHVGKSTLAGYWHVKTSPNFDLEKNVASLKKQIGAAYKPSQKLAYIVDTAKDERASLPEYASEKHGTSRYMHMIDVAMEIKKILLLDTPGAEFRSREQWKGIFYADVGVFMIEASKLWKLQLLDPRNTGVLSHFIAPLSVWRHSKEQHRRLIILITKMDEVSYDKEAFNCCSTIIQAACEQLLDPGVAIVPIAIDVDQVIGHNFDSNSDLMKWYDGPTFMECLEKMTPEPGSLQPSFPFLLAVNREYDKPYTGYILEGKILQGSIKKGNFVKVCPVSSGVETVTLMAEVRSIKEAKGEDLEEAGPGSMVGLQLHRMTINGRNCKKETISRLPTTCIFGKEDKIIIGNVAEFQVSDEFSEQLAILKEISIIWFGRAIPCQIVHCTKLENSALIICQFRGVTGSIMHSTISQMTNNSFLLKLGDVLTKGILLRFGFCRSVLIQHRVPENQASIVEQFFEEFNPERHGEQVKIECPRGPLMATRRVKSINEKHGLEFGELVAILSIDIREELA